MFGPPAIDDHVRVTRTQTRLWGGDVKAGSFGIVRETHYGFFSSELVIELADGTRVRLPTRDVRRTGGSGQTGLERRRQWHKAKLFAGFITAVMVAIPLLRFRMAGGEWGDLVVPVLEELVATVIALVTGPFGLLVVFGVAFLYVRGRVRR